MGTFWFFYNFQNALQIRKIALCWSSNPVKRVHLSPGSLAVQKTSLLGWRKELVQPMWAHLKFEINKEILPSAHEWICLGVTTQLCFLVIHEIRLLRAVQTGARFRITIRALLFSCASFCYMPRSNHTSSNRNIHRKSTLERGGGKTRRFGF